MGKKSSLTIELIILVLPLTASWTWFWLEGREIEENTDREKYREYLLLFELVVTADFLVDLLLLCCYIQQVCHPQFHSLLAAISSNFVLHKSGLWLLHLVASLLQFPAATSSTFVLCFDTHIGCVCETFVSLVPICNHLGDSGFDLNPWM